MPETSFTLGEHEADIRALLDGQATMQKDIKEIRRILDERKGERRVTLWVMGAASTIASVLVSYLMGRK